MLFNKQVMIGITHEDEVYDYRISNSYYIRVKYYCENQCKFSHH